MDITVQQMLALNAVVSHGSIQAAAKQLNKTHPSVIRALKNLEDKLGFPLFDRTGYRSVLTDKGKVFHKSVKRILENIDELKTQSIYLKADVETELNIVVGDITPLPSALSILRTFSDQNPYTRINLFFGNLYGPNEQLFDAKADLIIHHIDKSDARYEYRDFCLVPIVPVVAPDFLKIPITKNLRYSDLKDYMQCMIRDSATHSPKLNRFVLDDSPHLTVGDQHTKKEVILQGMGWGHMPLFLVEDELKSGRLISIEGKYIKGVTREIVIARLSDNPKGIMAERLWQSI